MKNKNFKLAATYPKLILQKLPSFFFHTQDLKKIKSNPFPTIRNYNRTILILLHFHVLFHAFFGFDYLIQKKIYKSFDIKYSQTHNKIMPDQIQ